MLYRLLQPARAEMLALVYEAEKALAALEVTESYLHYGKGA